MIPIKKGLFKNPKIPLESGGLDFLPDPDMSLCVKCKKPVSGAELSRQLFVCPLCGHHQRMGARSRIQRLCDENSFEEWDFSEFQNADHSFPGYAEKISDAKSKSGENEAVIAGKARILGNHTAIFAMDYKFLMGSMGTAVGENLTRVFEKATAEGLPVVGFTLSGGARMQEGILSLMQMAKVSGAVKRHSDAGLLYIAILTDPTAGGVTASFAMQADIILAEPGALICFAGPRVIEQTIRQKLPEGFQKAEFLLKKGFIDKILPRGEQKAVLAKLLKLHENR